MVRELDMSLYRLRFTKNYVLSSSDQQNKEQLLMNI